MTRHHIGPLGEIMISRFIDNENNPHSFITVRGQPFTILLLFPKEGKGKKQSNFQNFIGEDISPNLKRQISQTYNFHFHKGLLIYCDHLVSESQNKE